MIQKSKLLFQQKNPLFFYVAFLLLFIPLYPKLPLFSPLADYIVRVRLEDVLVGLGILGAFALWIRGRFTLPQPVTKLVGLYVLAGLLSIFSGLFLIQTIPWIQTHILKSGLHWLRYLEYFSLMFLVYVVVRTRLDLQKLVWVMVGASLLVNLYGIGQKHAAWPVYSTMNLEYASGVPLVLQSSATRVQSTFGGHYDYAAYLVLLTPLSLALFFSLKQFKLRMFVSLIVLLNFWGLMVSASRSGVAGVVLGLGLVCLAMSFSGKLDRDFWLLSVRRLVTTFSILVVMLLGFGQNLTALFSDALKPIVPEDSPLAFMVYQEVEAEQYAAPQPRDQIPPDVVLDQPEEVETVVIDESGQPRVVVESRARQYSECAKERGLSLCIRTEALWPQATAGFQRNPILGSGYGTLNKANIYDFTEADSTDNNYLRILGETGLFGFVSYFAILGYLVFMAGSLWWRNQDDWSRVIGVGFVAGLFGLLVNAVLIDVFAASKVAFTLWALAGLVISYKLKVQS